MERGRNPVGKDRSFIFFNFADASMVSQPPINPSSYPNPNQLALHVNKMSLQDEQYHPNSQFAPPLVSILQLQYCVFLLKQYLSCLT